MADIKFDEDQEYRRPVREIRKPFLVRLVLATKLVSTDEQANYVLIGVAVFCIVVAIALPFIFGGPSGTVLTPSSPSWPRSATP